MRKFFSIIFVLLIVLGLIFSPSQPAQASERAVEHQGIIDIYYVDADASGDGSGTDWANAYLHLQDALAVADYADQIWVAEGIYYPDDGNGQFNNYPWSTFELITGVELYGGFDPDNGVDAFDERNWEAYPTVLSGDIDHETQPDVTDSRGVVVDPDDIRGENTYHVVSSSNTDPSAHLEGFFITAGLTNGDGGGVHNYNYGSPSLENVTISGNLADTFGGGMYNSHNSSPFLTNVTISGNSASEGGGMANLSNSNPNLKTVTISGNSADEMGGGMYNDSSRPILRDGVIISGNLAPEGGGMYNNFSDPNLTDVTISGNSADSVGAGMHNHNHSNPTLTKVIFFDNSAAVGGGMYNDNNSSPVLTNVAFFSNLASMFGGGMYNDNSIPHLTNVIFAGNSAFVGGGGMYNVNTSSPYLTNVTFSGNSAATFGGGIANYNSTGMLVNTILWGNTANVTGSQIYNGGESSPIIAYSNIEGCGGSNDWVAGCGMDFGGNIDDNPLFEQAPGNLHLQDGSPSIDSGTNDDCPDKDLDGNQRPINGTCDMGAYEK